MFLQHFQSIIVKHILTVFVNQALGLGSGIGCDFGFEYCGSINPFNVE